MGPAERAGAPDLLRPPQSALLAPAWAAELLPPCWAQSAGLQCAPRRALVGQAVPGFVPPHPTLPLPRNPPCHRTCGASSSRRRWMMRCAPSTCSTAAWATSRWGSCSVICGQLVQPPNVGNSSWRSLLCSQHHLPGAGCAVWLAAVRSCPCTAHLRTPARRSVTAHLHRGAFASLWPGAQVQRRHEAAAQRGHLLHWRPSRCVPGRTIHGVCLWLVGVELIVGVNAEMEGKRKLVGAPA